MLAAQTGLRFDRACSRVYPLGRAAGLVALDDALGLLDSGARGGGAGRGRSTATSTCRCSGPLDGEGRLRTGQVPDGFVPGEGAAFLLVTRESQGRRHGNLPLARVVGVGRATEAGHLYSAQPHRGDGLAQAFRAVLDAPGTGAPPAARAPVARIYAGLNGESYWGKEWRWRRSAVPSGSTTRYASSIPRTPSVRRRRAGDHHAGPGGARPGARSRRGAHLGLGGVGPRRTSAALLSR